MSGKVSGSNVDREIDETLRRVFRQKEGEQVPDRFTKLLDQLRLQDSAPTRGDRE